MITLKSAADKLNVSTRTILRWRKKGLRSQKIKIDGKSRIMFIEEEIEQFVSDNPSQIHKATSFSRLTESDKQLICDRAKEICHLYRSPNQMIKTIAQETNRAIGTVRQVIHDYNILNPDHTISCSVLTNYIYNPIFDHTNAKKIILSPPEPELHPSNWNENSNRYFRLIAWKPFSREEECDLFRRYNFLRYRSFSTEVDECQILRIRHKLIYANLRIVVNIAKQLVRKFNVELFKLISEGNMILLRAIDRFDYARGYKFSTYVYPNLYRNMCHNALSIDNTPDQNVYEIYAIDKTEYIQDIDNDLDREHLKELISDAIKCLTHREQIIISSYYGFIGNEVTLSEIGRQYGLSKERVRQIKINALEKMRKSLDKRAECLIISK